MNKREVGKYGEEKAIEYLEKKGYEIIARNYRTGRGEIDIIARDQQYIVFIEVKLRKSLAYGYPQTAVDYRKQEKIRQLAQYFLLKNGLNTELIRFDVISILVESGKSKLEHFINAF
ncbi:MAG: YraN family protein [Halanaerobiales bacterium]